MITFFSRKRTSSLALAIALATGAAVATTAVMPAEASAQRKKKKDENDGGGYSKEFIAVYQPLNELMNTEGSDLASQRAQFDALAGLLNTPDEKIAGGGLMFNSGVRLQDPALQLQGMEAMLASGKVDAANAGRYNFIAYQLADRLNMTGKARTYLQAAIDNNFTTDTITPASLRIAMMESYFGNSEFDAGFKYLKDAVAQQKAAGQPVDEAWYRRGISVAYENELSPTVYEVATMWLADFPSEGNWRDAINIARNLNEFKPAEMLDLFRLARQTGALNSASDYDFYIEVADARRLPSEVKSIIEEGKAAGILVDSNLYMVEQLGIANSRLASDRADLPALEADASAPNAGLRTVVAAGDAFLSYGQYDKAIKFYERAVTMPGVEMNEELNRLAIAQIGAGDYAAARESLSRISGSRMPLAMLWTAYADELEGETGAAPAAPATM
ncbi:tetratricopeptide repeat protein [Erythrobacter sp. SCSIO 43205]|uniref:tetratricopeptide repeat protein n=1 Tax=Erythrobacter sp. SCSIO 43205 TaxID=2779361 RepID=UPI001CA7F176|nr:tetratricopeptide repeat protein [Erythrobacter sp. SCSIO 43205]UAB77193.1 tetratricopeptide repeat protein [Erythrobacter sp. SCSIO 43205]